MPTALVPIRDTSFNYLCEDNTAFISVVRFRIWEDLVHEVRLFADRNISDPIKNKQCRDSITIMAGSDSGARKQGEIPGKVAKQLRESTFDRIVINELMKRYPLGDIHCGWPRSARNKLNTKFIGTMQKACCEFARLFERLRDASRGSIFDMIPSSVYVTILAILLRYERSHKLKFWTNDAELKIIEKRAFLTYPGETPSEREKECLAAGVRLIAFVLGAPYESRKDKNSAEEVNLIASTDIYNVINQAWQKDLETGDTNTRDLLVYFDNEEEEDFLKYMEAVSPVQGMSMRRTTKRERSHCKRRKGDRKRKDPKLDVACYYHDDEAFAEDEANCAIVPSELLAAGLPLVPAFFGIVHEIETTGAFKQAVRNAFPERTDPRDGYFRNHWSKEIAEVMRMCLLMENRGEHFMDNIDRTCMINHFFARMDDTDGYKPCIRPVSVPIINPEAPSSDEGHNLSLDPILAYLNSN